MNLQDHAIAFIGGSASVPVILANIDTPSTQQQLIGLLSAVLVQTSILGLAELKKWFASQRRKNAEKKKAKAEKNNE